MRGDKKVQGETVTVTPITLVLSEMTTRNSELFHVFRSSCLPAFIFPINIGVFPVGKMVFWASWEIKTFKCHPHSQVYKINLWASF